jgi:hypothetical protein
MPPESNLEKLYHEIYPGAPEDHQKHLTTAQHIEHYVRAHNNFETLTADLSEHGVAFLETQKAQGLSTLLYAELTLEAYLRDAPSSQQSNAHLKTMQTCLHDLYNAPLKNTAKNLDTLLQETTTWLAQIKAENTTNPQQVSNLCSSLYTVLAITAQNLNKNNTYLKRNAAAVLGVTLDFDKNINKINKILPQIKALVSQLNTVPKAQVSEAETPGGDKLAQGLEHLNALLTLRKQHPNLTGDLKAAQTILDALDNNEKKTSNRDYALTLIQDNQTAFEALLEHAPEAEKQAWDKRMQALTHPDPIQQTTNAALFALS